MLYNLLAVCNAGTDYIDWPIVEIYSGLQLLKYHEGLPKLEKLRCPIFTQDKYNYLSILPLDMIMLSCKILLHKDFDENQFTQYIER